VIAPAASWDQVGKPASGEALGHTILLTETGDAIPAASGFDVGTSLRHLDYPGVNWTAVLDAGATNQWCGPLLSSGVIPMMTGASGAYLIGWNPAHTRKGMIWGYEGHTCLVGGNTSASNYFEFDTKYNGASLTGASWSLQSTTIDTWNRVPAAARAIKTVVDFALMDGNADATSLDVLHLEVVETGSQTLRFSAQLWMCEVLD